MSAKGVTKGNEPEGNGIPTDGTINQADIDAYGLPTTTGNYTLVENISVASGAHITESNQTITIDLNGFSIAYTGSESMYKIGQVSSVSDYSTGIVLTIKDSSSAKTGKIFGDKENGYTSGGSTDNWYNGSKVGPDPGEGGRGGCIQVEYTNTFLILLFLNLVRLLNLEQQKTAELFSYQMALILK